MDPRSKASLPKYTKAGTGCDGNATSINTLFVWKSTKKKKKTVQLTAGRRYVKWRLGFRMSPVTVMARTCSNDWQHGTFMGIPHKVPF